MKDPVVGVLRPAYSAWWPPAACAMTFLVLLGRTVALSSGPSYGGLSRAVYCLGCQPVSAPLTVGKSGL